MFELAVLDFEIRYERYRRSLTTGDDQVTVRRVN